GDHLVDEADAEGFLSVDRRSGENELQRDALAHETWKPLRPAVARRDPELDLGLAEFGVLGGDAQMAGEGELAPAAEREAVHGGDDRLAAGLELPQHRLPAEGARLPVERPLERELRDVGPGHECLRARAREDGAA